MKKIIDGKTYNTETATLLGEKGTGRTADFSDWYEELYVTPKGAFFISFWGGAMTGFAEISNNGRNRSEGSGIKMVSKEYAQKFLNDASNVDEDLYVENFGLEEG